MFPVSRSFIVSSLVYLKSPCYSVNPIWHGLKFEGRKNVHSFLEHKDLQAIGRVGSQKVTIYVCFSMKFRNGKLFKKQKGLKVFPWSHPCQIRLKRAVY